MMNPILSGCVSVTLNLLCVHAGFSASSCLEANAKESPERSEACVDWFRDRRITG